MAILSTAARRSPGRALLLTLAALFSATSWAGSFVSTAKGGGFVADGQPYRFFGANFWAATSLGSAGPGGDRARLIRELDRLHALGVSNLRLMALTEGPDTEPYRIVPSVQPAPGRLNEEALAGLDFTLVEMAKRHMRAVLCLGNFWQWSGGFAQYVSWAEGSAIPYPAHGEWDAFQDYAARFYENRAAQALFANALQEIVLRTNTLSGQRYGDDPTIMAWELVNEPRARQYETLAVAWMSRTAAALKRLDPRHLVTTGSEGSQNDEWSDRWATALNSLPAIDYMTLHIWPQNFGWYDPQDRATYQPAVERASALLAHNADLARRLAKPLVLEEFGLARDWGAYDPGSGTWARDHYFATLLGAAGQHDLAGFNFWAWGGEAQPPVPGGAWRVGEPLGGDPPHEPQGWYSVYASDASTLAALTAASRAYGFR